jgi:hypothetical protein
LRREIAQNVVGDAMGELIWRGSVGEQAAKGADDGIDGLSAERGKGVHNDDLAAETRRFQRRRNAGNACSQHADVGGQVSRGGARRPPHDPRRRRNS